MLTEEERKERARVASRKFYLKNKELVLARSREWSKNNKEKDLQTRREASKRYNLAHPEKVRQLSLKWTRKNKEKVNALHREAYRADPEKHALRKKLYKYKITPEEYYFLLDAQENKCAICSIDLKVPHFDHDHVTGKNREILCRFCNLVLGNAHDSIFILERSIEYLKKHNALNKACITPFLRIDDGRDQDREFDTVGQRDC
jgi:hypothetical protein